MARKMQKKCRKVIFSAFLIIFYTIYVGKVINSLYTLHPTLYTAAPLPGCLKGVEEHSTLGRIIACHLTKMVLLLYMLPHPHQSIAYYYHARLLSYDENHAYFLTKKSLDSSSPLYLH